MPQYPLPPLLLNIFGVLFGSVFFGIFISSYRAYKNLKQQMIRERYTTKQKAVVMNEEFKQRLLRLLTYEKSNDINELKVAIIEGDTILEEMLRAQGFQGETMAALIAQATISGILGVDRLWRFHRLRNILVHDSTFVLTLRQGQDSLKLLREVAHLWRI